MRPGDLVLFDGDIRPLAEATLPITAHVVNYGTGCFEGVRAYWNPEQGQLYALLLRPHLRRLARSARTLNLDPHLDVDGLEAACLELLARNGYRRDAYLRPMVVKTGETIQVTLTGVPGAVCAYTTPLDDYLDSSRGLSVTVSAWRRIDDNAIPARAKVVGSYVNAALASDEARARGFDEALMLTGGGELAEASSANVFLVAGGTLVTPAATDDILVGLTRGAVLELARAEGIPAVERTVDRSEVYGADEMFLCGTGVQVGPVTAVDGRPVGGGRVGPLTEHLRERYLAAARGRTDAFAHWRTPVYPAGSAAGR